MTDEEDQWFKRTYDHLHEVEQYLEELQVVFRCLSNDRKDLAKALIPLNRALSVLAITEENSILSLTLDKLADFHANTSTVYNYDAELSTSLVRVFADQVQSIRVSFSYKI